MNEALDLGLDGSICVVDVETTGLDFAADRIISVAAFRTDFDASPPGRLVGDTLTAVVNPQRRIDPKASAVNGFTNRKVRGKPTFAAEAAEIREFIGTRTVVGHNVSFDKRFLNAEFKRAGVKTLSRNRSACTMKAIANLMAHVGRHADKWGWLSLDRAVALFGVGWRKLKVHDAQEDAMLTAMLARKLWDLSKLPKREAKAEIKELVELWPEESRRGNNRTANRKRNAEAEDGIGCAPVVGWTAAALLLVFVVSECGA